MSEEELHMQLFEAIERGDLNGLKMLLEPPLTVNVILRDVYVLNGRCTRKPTLLIVAASFSQLHILQYLLAQGADPNIPDKRQRYPLHFAAMKGDIDILRTLLAAKAEVNKQDWDNLAPLHFCAAAGFISGAEALLDAGAAINIQTRTKETPLILAIRCQQIEMVNFLIKSRADVFKTALNRRSPLFFVRDAATTHMLIDAGADVNHVSDSGLTPLHQAVEEELLDVAAALIERGAAVNAQDSQKQTPLHIAASTGQAEMCQLLLENKAELKVLDIARRSPEMLARRGDHFNVLSVILSFHDSTEDEDAPLLVFKPFSGIVNSPTNAPNSNSDLKPEDFKFDITEQ